MSRTPEYQETTHEIKHGDFIKALDLDEQSRVMKVVVVNNERVHKVMITLSKGRLAPEIKKKIGGY